MMVRPAVSASFGLALSVLFAGCGLLLDIGPDDSEPGGDAAVVDAAPGLDAAYSDASRADGGSLADGAVPDGHAVDAHAVDAHAGDAAVVDAHAVDASATLPDLWTHRRTGSSPGPLFGPKMVYHAGRGTIIMVGGRESSATLEWNGTSWSEICDPCPMGVRVGHGLAYDPERQVVVLFGGNADFNNPTGTPAYDDMWELYGETWNPVVFAGSTRPSPRAGVYMAYDEHDDHIVLFGGRIGGLSSAVLRDVWHYDAGNWDGPFLPPGAETPWPVAREDHGTGGIYAGRPSDLEDLERRFVIYGGTTLTGELDDTWAWDGSSWQRICEDCTGISRGNVSMAFHAILRRPVLVGGYFTGTEVSGTWELGAGGWLQTSATPLERDTMGIAFDRGRGVLVIYGGNGDSCGGGDCDDLFEYTR